MISKKFLFLQDINLAFTVGGCENLSESLNKLYQLEIYGIAPIDKTNPLSDNKLRPFHHVYKYNNYYIDIEGMWTETDLKNRWISTAYFVGLNNIRIIKTGPRDVYDEENEGEQISYGKIIR